MLADKERHKYERVWQREEYRRQAPGEALVTAAVHALGASPGESFIDFGAGTGRPARKLQQMGFDVTGVDFAHNCLDADVDVPMVWACLWNLPPMQADYGFCTDVMEHIPPEHVDDVLVSIWDRVGATYFQIATRPDVLGRLIGEPLHLTIQPAQWWAEKLDQYWDHVETTEGQGWMQATVR